MRIRKSFTAFLIVFAVVVLFSSAFAEEKVFLSFDNSFFRSFSRSAVINRDPAFDDQINKMAAGRGKVIKVEKAGRYRKLYRITVKDEAASLYNLDFRYYIYLDNEDSVSRIAEGDVYEFRGQLAAYTPLNVLRSKYIFDVILEEGALIIE